METNLKPNLIEPQYLKKVYKSNNVKSYSLVNSICSYSSNSLIYLIVSYGDLLIALIVLFFILYFRYKYFSNEKNIKKNEVIVNYIRDQNITDGVYEKPVDRIESDELIDDKLINVIKKEINKVNENELNNMDQIKSFDLQNFVNKNI